jgi:hypothetical protein
MTTRAVAVIFQEETNERSGQSKCHSTKCARTRHSKLDTGCDSRIPAGERGECEIDFKFETSLNAGDNMMKFKYIMRNVAYQHGKTVTFMPKPNFGRV